MKEIRDILLSEQYDAEQLRNLPIPESYRAAVVLHDDVDMFGGIPAENRDPAKSLTLSDVPTPEPGPGEVLVAVMASSINYNTVWSAIFEPMHTFGFLKRYAKAVPSAGIHDQPFHVLGSDMSGVVLRTGPGVHRWQAGDKVVAHCLSVELSSADGHDDSMLDPDQRIWGYETNYGGLAQLSLVKANQLMPKPAHLTWEESASSGLVHSTAYRQLISRNGAQIKVGDVVLIWGAAGGLGSYATQLVLRAGGIPVCVVSSDHKAELVRAQGAELVINRADEGFRFWKDPETPDPKEWKRFGARIRELTGGDDPDVVFEHPGRETMGASVYVARRGGTIVTCASTSGYQHQYDNRYLWMALKRIVGTHFANYREAWEANRLIAKGAVHPTLSAVYDLDEVGVATRRVHANAHSGKVGVLCLAPRPGLGVDDPEFRARHIDQINRFREPSDN
ncbi:crotonyl-CoA carboxylase/reductase [Nonomuraea sp. NPDC003707]